jgi:hypothetical protein
MRHHRRHGELFINGKAVGKVVAESASESWGFGQFTPSEGYSQFATIFGTWSLLLHAEDDRSRLSSDALDELRAAEAAIDALKAELRWNDTPQPVPVHQLTIDGTLIEWNH